MNLLKALEDTILWYYQYPRPLSSNDMSEDIAILRAAFVYLAFSEYHISKPDIIRYLRYGTDDAIANIVLWFTTQINTHPEFWRKHLANIVTYVNATQTS